MAVISLPRKDHASLTERVAAEVRSLMGRYEVTQVMLSEVLGVSQPQVGARLRGAVAFNVNEVALLADYFGVSPAELLGEQVAPRPGPDGGQPMTREALRARRDSNPKPSDPKVRPLVIAA